MTLKSPDNILTALSIVMTVLGILVFQDGYIHMVIGMSLLVVVILLMTKLLSFLKRQDIFSPKIILPGLFILVMVLGSLGSKDISIIYIANIESFQWQYYVIAILCYFIGIFAASKSNFLGKKMDWNPKMALIPVVTIFICATIATFVYFSLKGGIPLFSKDINVARFKSLHGIANILPYFNRLLFVISLISFIAMFRLENDDRVTKIIFWALIVSSTVILSLGGGRQFVQIAFLGLVAYHYVKQQLNLRKLILYFTIIISIFAAFGYIRTKSTIGAKSIEKQLTRIEYPELLPSWTAPPYVYCRGVAEIFHLTLEKVPMEMSYQKGLFTFGDFLVFLPGKRLRPDYLFMDEILGGDTSVSGGTALSFMTTFYLDFGLTGIIVGFFFVGYFLQKVYMKSIMIKSSKYIAIYCLLLYYCVLGIYGNALFTPIAAWEFLAIVLCDSFLTSFAPDSSDSSNQITL